jgi:hypothetical protein
MLWRTPLLRAFAASQGRSTTAHWAPLLSLAVPCFMPQTCPKGRLWVWLVLRSSKPSPPAAWPLVSCWSAPSAGAGGCGASARTRSRSSTSWGSWGRTQLGRGPRPPRTRPPSTLGTMAGAGAAVDPTPSQFRRKWGTDRHHLPTRHPEPGSSRVGGQTRRPGRRVGATRPGPAKTSWLERLPAQVEPPWVRRIPHPGGEVDRPAGSAPPVGVVPQRRLGRRASPVPYRRP